MAIMIVAGHLRGGKSMDTRNEEKLIMIFVPSMVVILVILSLAKTLLMFIFVGASSLGSLRAPFLSLFQWHMVLSILVPRMVLLWGPSGRSLGFGISSRDRLLWASSSH